VATAGGGDFFLLNKHENQPKIFVIFTFYSKYKLMIINKYMITVET